jgi:hypothetical protein
MESSSKIDLSNIGLLIIDCVNTDRALKTLNHCADLCSFRDILFLTDKDVETPNHVQLIKIPKIDSHISLDNFIAKDLHTFLSSFKVSHFLMVQYDGFIINPNAWSEDFLNYDFIGAPSITIGSPPLEHGDVPFFNSGFCLFTLKFLQEISKIAQEKEISLYPLDGCISGVNCIDNFNLREHLTALGLRYPKGEVACKFSIEYGLYKNSFGYHSAGFQHINSYSLENHQVYKQFVHWNENTKIKLYQIGYKQCHDEYTMKGFNFYLNYPNSIFQENAVISRLIDHEKDQDWLGFFPYRVNSKITEPIDYEHCFKCTRWYYNRDVLCLKSMMDKNHGAHNVRSIHPDMWDIFDKIMVKLKFLKDGEKAFEGDHKMIYMSSFIAKASFLQSYNNEMLKPAISLMMFDEEIYHLVRQKSDYSFPIPLELARVSNLNHWTHIPFLLERMITFYCYIKNIKFVNVL